jgi:geranylgeranyl diphosphate synthase type II
MSPEADLQQVEAMLAHYSRVTRTAMEDFLSSGQPAEYLYDLVREYPGRGGKGIRPALLLASCQAFGGSLRDGLGAAVALEMLHNAFLIHDDVEDSSPSRRGAATLHAVHGVALAVNAGDALAALALRPLLDRRSLGSRLVQQLVEELLTMVRQTTEGQALELGWRRDNVVDLRPADYLALAGRKTCWYTTVAPLRMGSLVGSRGTSPLEALSRFGFYLGIAFQIRDDLLSIVGSGELHGKEAFGDLREGKRTLMLLHLLAEAGAADRAWLVGYLATHDTQRTAADAAHVLELMDACGSLAYAVEYADGMALAASHAFDEAFAGVADSPELRFLRGLVPYMVARSA